MKIALCLSGQPRFVEKTYPFIYNNIIVPNNADVFVHTWFDKDDVGQPFRTDQPDWANNPNNKVDPQAGEKILNLYKPKSYKFEKQKTFFNNTLDMEPTFLKYGRTDRTYFVNAMHCMWYSVAQANLLKEIYRLENDIQYDYTIRCRMDAIIPRPIKCEDFEPDILWVSHDRQTPNQIDDWFALSRNEIMNVYSNCFHFMDYCHQICMVRDGLASNENLIYILAQIFNLQSQIIPNFKIEFVRPWS